MTVHRAVAKILGKWKFLQMLDFFYQNICFRPPSEPSKMTQAFASWNNNGRTIAVSFVSYLQVKPCHGIKIITI